MSDSVLKLVMCRSAAEPLDHEAFRGYYCQECGREVQVSPTGRLQVESGPTVMEVVFK